MDTKQPAIRNTEGGKMTERYVAPLSLLRGCGYSYEDLARPRIAIIRTRAIST